MREGEGEQIYESDGTLEKRRETGDGSLGHFTDVLVILVTKIHTF